MKFLANKDKNKEEFSHEGYLLLIDNYDSFTYNIVHAFCSLGQKVEVIRCDALSVDQILEKTPNFLVIGPGPGRPGDAGVSKELIKRAEVPLLGICLGHQAIGEVFGAKLVRADFPQHGKTSLIHHRQEALFQDVPTPFEATRYHSLVLKDLSSELTTTAWTQEGVIMGIQHRSRPIFGVQFHPESIASTFGLQLLKNFCAL